MDYNIKNVKIPTTPYPVDSFPPVLKNVINALHQDSQLPVEMIGSTVLAAAALGRQGFVDVISPYGDTAEPCSLYFMTLAESSEGKSTLYNKIMSPFHDFAASIRQENLKKLEEHKKELKKWTLMDKMLGKKMMRASESGNDAVIQKANELFDKHQDRLSKDPALREPKQFNLVYEDTTIKAFMDGLIDQPSAAINSSEAITFFKSRLKNHLGLLNKAWGGESYLYNRANKLPIDLRARLTLLLLVQPGTFMSYLAKYGEEANDSGFLTRFLYTNVRSTQDLRNGNLNYEQSNKAIEEFHKSINKLLITRKEWLIDSDKEKIKFHLSDEAKAFFSEKHNEYQIFKKEGGKWSHIKSHVSKAGSQAIRIAAAFGAIEDDHYSLSKEDLECGYQIVEWHLEHAAALFYSLSEEHQFKEQVYTLHKWIYNRFHNPKGMTRVYNPLTSRIELANILPRDPFQLRTILNSGPPGLRDRVALEPILNELIALGFICTMTYQPNGAEHISLYMPNNQGVYCVVTSCLVPSIHILSSCHTGLKSRFSLESYDKQRFNHDNNN
ncbi:TPA: DUF3987 domain-containing protein [Enterobacter hormaechei subsp. xiangfangensis]|nr:DUF3987 domain-containing protein [Enterobacter hormaechei subsp. xiangfangensis]